MNKIIKIKEEKLEKQNVGTFLYCDKKELNFCERPTSVMFEVKEDCVGDGEKYSMNFDSYVAKFMDICPKINNKPSLLFLNCVPKDPVNVLNGKTKTYKFVSGLEKDEDLETFNTEPSITCVASGVVDALERLVMSRNDGVAKTDVYVFFNSPEDYKTLKYTPSLDAVVTVSRSRKIYFVLNFQNPEKFIETYGKEMYETIGAYCPVKFLCNKNGVVDIQIER